MICKMFGFPKPTLQFRFHPERLWRADFAWPDQKLLVEIEGGIWMRGGGGHSHPMGIEKDIEKHNAAVALGWRLIRVTDKMLARKRWPELIVLLQKFL